MAASVTASDARIRFGRLLDRVSRGEEIVVTRHHEPAARLVPVTTPARHTVRVAVTGLRELRREIAERREQHPLLTAAELKSLIEEGRR